MAPPETVERAVDLSVRNVGGIDETEVTFAPGVTVLAGRNATNRTSLLQAVMAALGSDRVSLKGDADTGSVELTVGDDRYTRTLERSGSGVATGGDPYLDDPTVADLFAFLLEGNEARRAVARGDDLRDVIMRPVDTAAIEREIADLEEDKRRLDDELSGLDHLAERLPELESERARLRDELEEARERLRAKEASLDEDVEEPRETEAELETKLDELGQARGRLERVDRDVDSTEASLEALREEREELRDRRSDLPDAPDEAVADVQSEINRLRERKQEVQSTISDLQTVVQFNEDVLHGTGPDVLEVLQADDDGAPPDGLLADDGTVECWTCGSTIPTGQVTDTLDSLRSLREDHVARQRELAERIDELRAEKESLEEKRRRHEEVHRRLSEVDDEIARRKSELETLRERREEVAAEIDRLESTVEALEREEYSEVLETHREANELEFEVERLERDLDDVDEEMADIEDQLERRETLEDERATVDERLTDNRTRIERLERTAVQAFNDHMETVLDALGYDNLERIWIERVQPGGDGRPSVTGAAFELHVVRSTGSGSVYEDTVDHLSESEREVTGLVFALAGYLVHDVHETVPFMLLDSLEAIDAGRIARLVDHLREHADYLVVALLEEDAAALDEQFPRVSDI